MRLFTLTFFIYLLAFGSFAQTENDTIDYAAELAKLEAELDSFGIFSLIDSVLFADFKPPSEFNIRFGYNSNVVSAGRNYGINQHGLSPGISFYHKNGWFADVAGFWNSEFDPKYNLTMLSAGYMGIINKHFSYTLDAEKWFYHYEVTSDFNSIPDNSIGGSFSYSNKFIYSNLDYSYLFGDGDAHRIIGNINGNIKFNGFWGIKKITIFPGLSAVYGNDQVVIQFNGDILDELLTNEYLRQNLSSEDFQAFLTSIELTQEQEFRLRRINNNNRLSPTQKRNRTTLIYLQNEEVLNYLYDQLDEVRVSYGIMNYSFSLPISLSFGKFSTLLSYTYSVPMKLPGETLELEPIGFFGITFSYRIPVR